MHDEVMTSVDAKYRLIERRGSAVTADLLNIEC